MKIYSGNMEIQLDSRMKKSMRLKVTRRESSSYNRMENYFKKLNEEDLDYRK